MSLGSSYVAEKSYWAEHGHYTTVLNGKDGVGWQPEGYSGGGRMSVFIIPTDLHKAKKVYIILLVNWVLHPHN